MLKCTFCVIVALVFFVPIANWLCATHRVSPEERARAAELFVNPIECRPEPGERLAFLVGLLFVPAAAMTIGFAIHRCRSFRAHLDAVESHWLIGIVAGSIILVIGCYGLVEQQFFHVRQSIFVRQPIIATALFIGTLIAITRHWRSTRFIRFSHFLAVSLIAVVALACVFDEGGSYSANWHFAAAFNSVVQVHLGKALLVDCRGQYGLYAHFLQPLFALTGLSVLTFTMVMASLLAVAYLAIWRVMAACLRNRPLAVVGFFALVFTSWFYLKFGKEGRFQWVDPYFQYHPIRFLFPAISVWLVWSYFRKPSRRLYWASMLVLPVGVLWNFDAGLPTLLAWLGALGFSDLFQHSLKKTAKRTLVNVVSAAGTFTIAVAVYSVAIYLQHGAAPDFSQFFRYQKLFYVSGFFMLPMPLPGTWMLVVAVYLLGLTFAAGVLSAAKKQRPQSASSVSHAIEPELATASTKRAPALAQHVTAVGQRTSSIRTIMMRRPSALSGWNMLWPREGSRLPRSRFASDSDELNVRKAKLVFFLSILGLGLFSYFQGRSHEYVITLVWWPCFILLAIFLDTLLSNWRGGRKGILHATVFVAVAWLLSGYAWSTVTDLECMKNLVVDQFPRSDRPHAMEIRNEAKLLRDHLHGEGEVLILAPAEPVLHLLSGVPSIAPCSYIEMVLVDDYADVMRRLAERPHAKVYIDKNVFRYHWKRVGSRGLIDAIQKEFLLAAETPMGLLFERGDLSLKSDHGTLCHTGFKDGLFPAAMEFAPIRIDHEFAIELIVKPEPINRPWRVMLSNHCGSPHHKGMMLFESHPNVYELVCGTGDEWRHAAKFHVPPGVWSHLAISVNDNSVRVFRNGELVDQQPVDGWRLNNAQTPLILGDWMNHDCPFQGRIHEFRILNRALGDSEVAENCRRFKNLDLH